MQFHDNLPIYIQIINYIKRNIIVGKFKEEEKLPSVRELSSLLKVNPNTIQRSYQELEREGLVFTQRGMGTFVTGDKIVLKELKINLASNLVKELVNNMNSLGFNNKEILILINKEMEGKYNE